MQFGDFFHDICVHAVLRQPTLAATASLASDQPLMRWCAFPGERLLKKVQQEVNGNHLDEYTYHATNLHREYRVAPNKRTGWNRCVGQEESEAGFVSQPNWANSGLAPSAVTSRVQAGVCTGSQTPSGQKDTTDAGNLELFVPLLFWYNKDVRLAVPSVAIPYGQRFINIELATFAELVDVVPRGAGTWASPGGSVTEPTGGLLKSIKLYVNNIFVNPEVHRIYIKRIGFSLIRVHRQQIYNATQSSAEVLLQQLKWPIEYLFVGMKVKDYHASSTAAKTRQYLDRWHTFSQVNDNTYTAKGQTLFKEEIFCTAATSAVTVATADGKVTATSGAFLADLVVGEVLSLGGVLFRVTTAGASGTAIVQPKPAADYTVDDALAKKVTVQGLQVETTSRTNTLDTVTIKAHGINIYDNFPTKFFNAYTAYHYGGPNINTPEDSGVCFIPFCLYPGTYQPSGHINVSRAREFYINYTSSVCSSSTECSLVVLASAINFLLISDGSAVLRYST